MIGQGIGQIAAYPFDFGSETDPRRRRRERGETLLTAETVMGQAEDFDTPSNRFQHLKENSDRCR